MITIIDYENIDVEFHQKIKNFIKKNETFLDNVIVKSFLEDEKNKLLLITAICSQNKQDNKNLDTAFRKFYFNIRFTSFISNTIYFNSINYDKKYRGISSRYPLTMDKTIRDDTTSTFKDIIEDPKAEIRIEDLIDSQSIEDYVVNPFLFNALKNLTPKQKEVIDLSYVYGLSDTEISKRLGKSQQAISKLHKKALKRIYRYISEKG